MSEENVRFQLVRGTTAQMDLYTGREGELAVDLSKNNIRIHNGVTQGGFELDIGDVNVPVNLNQTASAIVLNVGSESVTIGTATPSMVGLMSTTDKAKLDGLGNGDGEADPTNITVSATPDNITVLSSSGTNGVIDSATTSTAGVMSSADKTKLDGIASGAQVNAVTSVAGKTGAVTLVAADIPNLDTSKITTGTLAGARLPASSSAVFGAVKTRLEGTTLYIRNDSANA